MSEAATVPSLTLARGADSAVPRIVTVWPPVSGPLLGITEVAVGASQDCSTVEPFADTTHRQSLRDVDPMPPIPVRVVNRPAGHGVQAVLPLMFL